MVKPLGLEMGCVLELLNGCVFCIDQEGYVTYFHDDHPLPLLGERTVQDRMSLNDFVPEDWLKPLEALIAGTLRTRGKQMAQFSGSGAGNGRDIAATAAPLCGQKSYDLILMDLNLPDMSGIELTLPIRVQEGEVMHVPIVAMTADAMAGTRERCLEAGMGDYLSPPGYVIRPASDEATPVPRRHRRTPAAAR